MINEKSNFPLALCVSHTFFILPNYWSVIYMKFLKPFGEVLILGHFQGLVALNRDYFQQ